MTDASPSNGDKENTPKSGAFFIKNDLIGVDDWKRSKVGYLMGVGPARRAVGTIVQTGSQSASRLRGLALSLKGSTDHLPEVPQMGEPDERFYASMELHGVSEDGLDRILLNTFRATYLYLGLTIVSILAATISHWLYPSTSIWGLIIRLGPLPLLLAMVYKHSFTNWLVRRRRLDGAVEFITSMDWLAKRK